MKAKRAPVSQPAGGWQTTSYMMQTNGDFAVTKHTIMTAPGGFFYIAWLGKQELGTFDTAAAAKAACEGYPKGGGR